MGYFRQLDGWVPAGTWISMGLLCSLRRLLLCYPCCSCTVWGEGGEIASVPALDHANGLLETGLRHHFIASGNVKGKVLYPRFNSGLSITEYSVHVKPLKPSPGFDSSGEGSLEWNEWTKLLNYRKSGWCGDSMVLVPLP